MEVFEVKNTGELEKVAKSLAGMLKESPIALFFGEMGAGKTTFIKSLCKELGSEDVVTSPTFSIINDYSLKDGSLIHHFDFYRIKSVEEAYDLGYEEYFYSGEICLVEWPQLIESLLPESYIKVTIDVDIEDNRNITLNFV